MRLSSGLAATAAVSSALLFASVSAQTYTKCNPLENTCPSDPALGGSMTADFTSGASSGFTAEGDTVSYGSNGAAFTISQSGDSPQIISNWYIMWGRVEVVMQAAPGVGIVSSAVLQSDDLDEIDWEWLGAYPTEVQTNYFGKGITGTYNRGTTVSDPTSQSGFNTYVVDWTSEATTWSINGEVVRTLTPATAETNQYPQTPMQVKIGSWSAGDPSNAPGTIAWAGGPTDYSDGPFTMYVQSVSVTDYSTGNSYSYSGTSGSWQDIISNGGTIYSGGLGGSGSSAPIPVETSASYPTTLIPAASSTVSTYPGLPSGWTVLSSGKVVPPSSAPTHQHSQPTSYSLAVPPPSSTFTEPVQTAPPAEEPLPQTTIHPPLPPLPVTPTSSHTTASSSRAASTYVSNAAEHRVFSSRVAGCALLWAALLL